MTSGSVETEGAVGEELADERVGGEADGNTVETLGEWSRCFVV